MVMYIYIYIHTYIYIYIYRVNPCLQVGLYNILFYIEAYVHESMTFFANTPFVWAPHASPFIAHTIAQYIVSPRPPFFAIYTIQYCL